MISKMNSLRSWWLLGLAAAALLLAGCASSGSGAQADEARLAASPTPPLANVVAVEDDAGQGETIQLIGIVESLTGTTAVVNGLTVETGSAASDGALLVGATIQVQGRQSAGGVVAAEYVWILQPPAEPSPEATSGATPFVIEGPVQAISGNRLRVHGFNLELDDDVRLKSVQVGDVLRISGDVDKDRLDDLFDDIDDALDDNRYVAVRNTQLGFLSHEVYASPEGQVWRDSGSCASAPPGWASAGAWRSRCSGEFGGGPPAAGNGASSSSNGSSSSGTGAGGNGDSSSSGSSPQPPPAPPPAGGGGDSGSGSGSGSGS